MTAYPKPDYTEFDDLTGFGRPWSADDPWAISRKAEQALYALAREHGCRFDPNPGGAEFNGYIDGKIPFRLQIGDGDDIENLWSMRRTIEKLRGENP